MESFDRKNSPIMPGSTPNQSMSPSSTSPQPTSASPTTGGGGCICRRPLSYVYCKRCDFEIQSARVQMQCSVHPRVQALMDLSICPKCRGTSTLQESPQ